VEASSADGHGFREEAGVRNGELLLTFVGRLVPIKRVDVLLRAVCHARELGANVRLAVVGDGALRPELEALATELGIADAVFFAGYRGDMVPVAVAGDFAVLSSDNEGTPVSLIEAAAAGKAAASTTVGGVPDVVLPESGLLTPPGEPEALGEAIATLASDAERRASMGEAARRHVTQRFTVERLVSDIGRLYEGLIRETRAMVDGTGGPARMESQGSDA
jgi:glycosyltransferase involved in cell wall biosynthesis